MNQNGIERALGQNRSMRYTGSMKCNEKTGQAVWESQVKDCDSAKQYFMTSYPQFGPELCQALANRVDDIVKTSKDMTDEEKMKYVRAGSKFWDYEADVNEQRQKGLIAVAMKKYEELMNEK